MASLPRTVEEKEDFVRLFHVRLENSYRARRDHQTRWEELQRLYKGEYFTTDIFKDHVASMLHFAAVRQMAANLYFQDPAFNFIPRTVAGRLHAMISQQVYRLERKIMKAESAERRAIDYALKYGTGVLLHGWNTGYGIEPAWAQKRVMDPEAGHPTTETTGETDLRLPLGQWTEHDSTVKFGHPNVKAIAPWDFFIDADALTADESPWLANRFQRRWVDVIRDLRYDKAARQQMREAGPSGISKHIAAHDEIDVDEFKDDIPGVDSGLSTLYQIYDKTTQMLYIVSPDIELPLKMTPYPFLGKDGPYEILQFFENDDSFWAIPYMDTFTSEIEAVNKALTGAFDHYMRWGKTRGFYDESIADEDKMNEVAHSEDGVFTPIRTLGDRNIDAVLKVMPEFPINADTWRIIDVFNGFMQRVSAISENDLGSGQGIQTATEASIINQQSSLRKGDMRFRVDVFLEGSARKTVSLLRQFYNAEDVIPVVGPEGQMWDVDVTREILNGEYDVEIEPGSTEKVDRQARFRQMIELWREAANASPVLAQQGVQINLAELFKRVLKEADVIKNPDTIIQRIPPPSAPPGAGQPPSAAPAPGQRGGTSPARLGTVNNAGRMPEATDAFQNGRNLSELAGRN